MLVVPQKCGEHPMVKLWAERTGASLESPEIERPEQLAEVDLVLSDASEGWAQTLGVLHMLRYLKSQAPFIVLTSPEHAEPDDLSSLGPGSCLALADLTPDSLELALGGELPAPDEVQSGGLRWQEAEAGQHRLEWSPFWERLTGQASTEDWRACVVEDDLARWNQVRTRALERSAAFLCDLRVRGRDGHVRWLRVHGQPGALGYSGTAVDVSDLYRDRAQTRVELDRVEAANRELSQFAFAAAHDLDEPLRTLEADLRSLQDGDERISISQLGHTAGRMRSLVRDLLECAQAAQSRAPFERIQLDEALDWALENLGQRIAESQAHIERTPLPAIDADPIQLARLFQNLIANALKFRGGETPRVRISALSGPDALVICVSDNGIGIAPEHHERIFEPFKRVHARPSAPVPGDPGSGSGIGLALCRSIALRHGGSLSVESKPGEGATFNLRLPRP